MVMVVVVAVVVVAILIADQRVSVLRNAQAELS